MLLFTKSYVTTSSGTNPAFCSTGKGEISSEVKKAGRKFDHKPPPSAEVKNLWSYTSTKPYAFIARTGKHTSSPAYSTDVDFDEI